VSDDWWKKLDISKPPPGWSAEQQEEYFKLPMHVRWTAHHRARMTPEELERHRKKRYGQLGADAMFPDPEEARREREENLQPPPPSPRPGVGAMTTIMCAECKERPGTRSMLSEEFNPDELPENVRAEFRPEDFMLCEKCMSKLQRKQAEAADEYYAEKAKHDREAAATEESAKLWRLFWVVVFGVVTGLTLYNLKC
jgi:hypothetical protein